jgi:hypothetical protein
MFIIDAGDPPHPGGAFALSPDVAYTDIAFPSSRRRSSSLVLGRSSEGVDA